MKRTIFHKLGMLAACGLAFAAPQANALTISANASGTQVDIIVSDLNELISAFDIRVLFGNPLLTATGYDLDPNNSLLTSGVEWVDWFAITDLSIAGEASVFFNSFESDVSLFAAQCPGGTCGSITLFSLLFDEDVSNVSFTFDWSDPYALVCEEIPGTAPGSIARQCYPDRDVPEPGTLALLGLGIFGLAMSRRRQQA